MREALRRMKMFYPRSLHLTPNPILPPSHPLRALGEPILVPTPDSSGGSGPVIRLYNLKSFTLSIENIQLSDSGNYSCETTRIVPPPSLHKSSCLILQVRPHLSLQKLNSSNDTCVHLLCLLESLKPEQVNFTWSRGERSLHPFTSYAMNSELHLCKPDWSEGDTITCYASYSSTQTPYSRSITLDFSHEGQTEIRLPVCVVLFSIFIISIVFIWMLFFIFKYKRVTCCHRLAT
ncbi:uncharacterized protein LOC107744632 [Sinocyclocheilus rhinocerous]|uniref:uncharacterized protein LOC107744632 n=1 Tax=Sinocyclocheilus rhinocerous TaxID=307959 RepID=UPI0007B84879|nr:PREDICTED: uncharacterized protein LOC107744632 [Sinocyclocheilus rhinocerous]